MFDWSINYHCLLACMQQSCSCKTVEPTYWISQLDVKTYLTAYAGMDRDPEPLLDPDFLF